LPLHHLQQTNPKVLEVESSKNKSHLKPNQHLVLALLLYLDQDLEKRTNEMAIRQECGLDPHS
jgi:hypothetical protein